MKSVQGLVLTAGAVLVLCALASASTQQASRDQIATASQSAHALKNSNAHVSKRDYHSDNSYWAIGLVLIPLLLLLCFPLFSTPYHGGHHGGHHGGWGWGRSAKEVEAIQQRVLKGVEQIATNLFSGNQ